MKALSKNEYIDLAMRTAEVIQENGKYWGLIQSMPGVWGQADTEAELLKELAECAASWIEARKSEGLTIPSLEFEFASNQLLKGLKE